MHVIVSRHPAAVAFIRESMPEFASAVAMESAAPADVRGNVVAGNLPLHLAALASQIVAVEFAGPPPRGAEYKIEEMRAAGARLVRYTVTAVPEPPRQLTWNDGMGSRGRRRKLLVGLGDAIHEFSGRSIHGIVAVVSDRYEKNGKWSNTTYSLAMAAGTWSHEEGQSWEEGEYFHGAACPADAVVKLRRSGCTAPDGVVLSFLQTAFPKTIERLTVRAAEIASVSEGR